MKMSRTAIKELTAAYRAVLKHAFIAAMGAMVVIGGASAETLVESKDISGVVISDKTDRVYNIVGDVDVLIKDSEFNRNSYTGAGGVIHTSDNKINLTIKDSKFNNNVSSTFSGGAIKTNPYDSSNIDGTITNLNISGSSFVGNHAYYDGGAVANFNALNISDTVFSDNTAHLAQDDTGKYTKTVDDEIPVGGGALALGAVSATDVTSINRTLFVNNIAGINGGAIGTRLGKDANNSAAKLNVSATFEGNRAYQNGGAIYNTFYANNGMGLGDGVTVTGKFVKNTAGKNGGAIFNDGALDKSGTAGGVMTMTDSVFGKNNANGDGGAIYNTGTIKLAGNNVFTGNAAGGAANDIHNMGVLAVVGGTTTIDGGITGDGALTVANGATLNIGTSIVEQGTLHLDGTVGLTIVDANNYGKLLANTYADDATTGRVLLTVATTGSYKIFNEGVNYTIVDAGAIYDVAQDDLGTGLVIISTKSVDKIAADTGLTDAAANTVAGLANTDSALANIASLNVQQALRDGDTEYVERETARANPVDKPVVQSVAQSVQGAVMTLAANRMAGTPTAGTMGRSGGDLSDADYGVWAQGMFNKSKFNGQFNGYTRGVSAGFDALIDKQYTIGLGYAFGHSDVHANGGRDTEIDSNSIFAYAQYKPSEWFVNAALNYTMSKYTETVDAFGVRLKSDYDTDAFGGQVMTGYDFASGLTPEVGLRYLHVTQDSYSNGLNHVSSDDTDFLTGIAGMKYRFAIENDSVINWFPELRAAATYDFVSDKAMSTVTMPGAASYVVDGDRLSRFGGEFGIGLTAEYNGLEISLVYDLNLHKDYTSQTGMAKFRYEF